MFKEDIACEQIIIIGLESFFEEDFFFGEMFLNSPKNTLLQKVFIFGE